MMPYMVGRDPETNEIMVGDRRTHVFFLRGPANEERATRDLVQAANENLHRDGMAADAAERQANPSPAMNERRGGT